MSDGTVSCKFWTWQRKISAIAGTIVVIAAACGILLAESRIIKKTMNANFTSRVESVADSLDSIRCAKRTPIDSAILFKLDRISVDIKRTTYFQEQSMTDPEYARAQAMWFKDSLRWARDK
jgi:hypothetical protein